MDHVSHSTGKGTPMTLNELIEALQDYAPYSVPSEVVPH